MSDRFLFRAWDKRFKEMNEVSGISFYGGKITHISIYHKGISFTKDINDIILMQSTGLKDKTGKLIFEGDIVKIEYAETILQYHVVEFFKDDAKFGWNASGFYLCKANQDKFEIIGNIFQHPELLK